jgi:putative ABC transport system permease protein
MQTWRERSNDSSFALLRLHDLRVSLTGESYVRVGTLAAIAGGIRDPRAMAAQQERLVVPTQLDASQPGRTILVPGKLVGVALGGSGAQIDRRFVERGRDLRPSDTGRPVAVIEGNFADYYDLPIPTCVRLAGRWPLAIVGRALQPGQFLVTRPGADFGAEAGYGVLYAPLRSVQLLSEHPGQVNELVLALRAGADPAAVGHQLRAAFARNLPAIGLTITPKASEDSYRILYEDARGDQRLVNVFAWLLLAGAAFASFNLVSRIIEAQRPHRDS